MGPNSYRQLVPALCMVVASLAGAQEPRVPAIRESILFGIDQTLQQRYQGADSVFAQLAIQYPDRPEGFLYQAAVLQSRSIDEESELPAMPFDSLIDLSNRKSKILLDDPMERPWAQFCLATALGFQGLAHATRGEAFGAYTKSSSATTLFEKLVAEDSSYFDAYTGVGTYDYWKSRKLDIIRWLPFVHDDRTLGIYLLKQCSLHGRFNRFAAMSALSSIYLDMHHFTAAEEVSRGALAAYPDNRIFLWMFCSALDGQEKFLEAVSSYKTLLLRTVEAQSPNPYNEIVCRLNLALDLARTGGESEVEYVLRPLWTIEKGPIPEGYADRAQAKFIQARDLIARIQHAPR